MAIHNTKSAAGSKPRKPYPDFPLCAHNSGLWCKKMKGTIYYFGVWADPAAAEQKYQNEKENILAGRKRDWKANPVDDAALTVKRLVNQYLNSKRLLLKSSELSPRTFRDCHTVCGRIDTAFGGARVVADLQADDFEQLRATLAKTLGPLALGIEIQRIRSVFKYGFDADLIESPVKFGPTFKKPSGSALRAEKKKRPARMLDAAAIGKLQGAADPQMKAMILLAINAGLGNRDIAMLPLKALDLKTGWINYPRPKTGMDRRAPLWPETVQALKAVLDARHEPKDAADNGAVFITRHGERWVRNRPVGKNADKGGTWIDSVGLMFGKLLREQGLKVDGVNFYSLRHAFATIGGESGEEVAKNFIMGHVPDADDMSARYRELFSDERLRRVTDYVRAWLFPIAMTQAPKEPVEPKAVGRRKTRKMATANQN